MTKFDFRWDEFLEDKTERDLKIIYNHNAFHCAEISEAKAAEKEEKEEAEDECAAYPESLELEEAKSIMTMDWGHEEWGQTKSQLLNDGITEAQIYEFGPFRCTKEVWKWMLSMDDCFINNLYMTCILEPNSPCYYQCYDYRTYVWEYQYHIYEWRCPVLDNAQQMLLDAMKPHIDYIDGWNHPQGPLLSFVSTHAEVYNYVTDRCEVLVANYQV